MSLSYLKEFGWTATVLAVRPQHVEGATLDPVLESSIPGDVEILRVAALPIAVTRRAGVGNLAIRSLPFLWRAGNRLLARGRAGNAKKAENEAFDLVFFSTTQFAVMTLGPVWKRRFHVPYVVDMQDPWLSDYYETTGTPPPGGQLKYRFSRFLANELEPRVMRNVSHVISVSPFYIQALRGRYPHLGPERFTLLPFGIAEQDFELAVQASIRQRVFNRDDGKQHWVYVGAAGRIMAKSLSLLFRSLNELRYRDRRWNQVRLHFIGTSYASANRAEQTVTPIAAEYGVADLVEEQTTRVPYFESLRLLQDADALLIVGSDSAAYNPSKLATYLFARKPLLAILHQDSPGIQLLQHSNGANLVTFLPENLDGSQSDVAQALQQTFVMAEGGLAPQVDQREMANYGAREMTRRLCEIFDRALERPQRE